MKFLIGFPFSHSVKDSGGLQALKKLAQILTDLDQTVYVIGSSFHNGKTIQISNPLTLDMDDIIVIYPEVVIGNPFKGKHVARWILYHTINGNNPVHFETPTTDILEKLKKSLEYTWGRKDEYFYLLEYYETKRKPEEKKLLTVYNLRLDEFEDYGLDREGYCHLFHKNNIDQSFVKEYNSEHIPLGDWDGIKKMFNSKKYFLTYDDSTYYLNIAALCGCIPVVLYKTKKSDYKEKTPSVRYGVAYGFEEIDYAEKTLKQMRTNLESIEVECLQTVKNFVKFWEEKLNK